MELFTHAAPEEFGVARNQRQQRLARPACHKVFRRRQNLRALSRYTCAARLFRPAVLVDCQIADSTTGRHFNILRTCVVSPRTRIYSTPISDVQFCSTQRQTDDMSGIFGWMFRFPICGGRR